MCISRLQHTSLRCGLWVHNTVASVIVLQHNSYSEKKKNQSLLTLQRISTCETHLKRLIHCKIFVWWGSGLSAMCELLIGIHFSDLISNPQKSEIYLWMILQVTQSGLDRSVSSHEMQNSQWRNPYIDALRWPSRSTALSTHYLLPYKAWWLQKPVRKNLCFSSLLTRALFRHFEVLVPHSQLTCISQLQLTFKEKSLKSRSDENLVLAVFLSFLCFLNNVIE